MLSAQALFIAFDNIFKGSPDKIHQFFTSVVIVNNQPFTLL